MARLIDPGIARIVARRIAGAEIPDSYLMRRLRRDLAEAVPRSEELVASTSGIAPPPPAPWKIIDRAAWAEANIAGMVNLMAPLAEKIEARRPSTAGDPVAWFVRKAERTVVSTEIGVLLGYISRRVLGQYDLLVADTPPERGRARRKALPSGDSAMLYFVGPNLVDAERRFGFIPEDFALWVAVHEMTHRFQFAGVPWLRDRFLSLVHRYMETVELDAKGLAGRLGTAARRLVSGSVPPEERNPVYLLASDEQKAILNDIQALMAVVEGHGNYVMDAVGASVIPSFRTMRNAFERRREQATVVQRVISNALGLEMKMLQYEMGQHFCESVVKSEGEAALARLWSGPEAFPSMIELREPERWLRRVA
ncbi:MAG: hypothetical protein GEU78_03515 [Actinobacteria bacterium]|nr:hypothetical protein [Actinomycetota bacterium]